MVTFVRCSLLLFFLLLSSTPSTATAFNPPYFVSYIDKIQEWWPDSDILTALGVPGYSAHYSYNVLNLAFYQSSSGPSDAMQPWTNPTKYFSLVTMQNITGLTSPTDAQFRTSLKALYATQNGGIKIIASCFGASDYPTKTMDPTALGATIGAFVKENQFDGVDIDWEDSASFNSGDFTGEYWLSNLTIALRTALPASDGYIITHAPQAPYFMGKGTYKTGAYLYVQKEVGNLIDWYNIQFYNQGSTSYSTYQTLFVESDGWSLNTSVFQIINGENDMHVSTPMDMVVIGKPVSTGDADNTGYVPAPSLESFFKEGIQNKWSAGFMDWQFSSDINTHFAFANTVASAWK